MADPRLTRRGLLSAALSTTVATALPLRSVHAQTQENPMRITCRFDQHSFDIQLDDTPSAQDLRTMLPLDLTIQDYSNNEKIAYLPRKLTETGAQPFKNEAPGDFCYYAPWGNLVFFYAGYRYSRGLIRLGRLVGDVQPLLTRGEYPLRITTGG